MGRNIKTNVEFFSHPTECRNANRMLLLRDKFENTRGYGLYFMIIEHLCKKPYLSVSFDEMYYELTKHDFREDPIFTKNLIDFCIKWDLFTGVGNSKFYYSKVIDKSIGDVFVKRKTDLLEERAKFIHEKINENL